MPQCGCGAQHTMVLLNEPPSGCCGLQRVSQEVVPACERRSRGGRCVLDRLGRRAGYLTWALAFSCEGKLPRERAGRNQPEMV